MRCGPDPGLQAGTLRHVPALLVWPVLPTLPQQPAPGLPVFTRHAEGGRTWGGGAVAGADHPDRS